MCSRNVFTINNRIGFVNDVGSYGNRERDLLRVEAAMFEVMLFN